MEAMKKVCSECPFRKNSMPGWLSTWTPDSLMSYVLNENPFPCHMTHDTDLSVEQAEEGIRCRGALIFMKNTGKLPRNSVTKMFLQYNVTPEEQKEVLSNSMEFREHHTIKEKVV